MSEKTTYKTHHSIIALVLQSIFPDLPQWCTAKKEKTFRFNKGEKLEVTKAGDAVAITFQTTIFITRDEYRLYFENALTPINE